MQNKKHDKKRIGKKIVIALMLLAAVGAMALSLFLMVRSITRKTDGSFSSSVVTARADSAPAVLSTESNVPFVNYISVYDAGVPLNGTIADIFAPVDLWTDGHVSLNNKNVPWRSLVYDAYTGVLCDYRLIRLTFQYAEKVEIFIDLRDPFFTECTYKSPYREILTSPLNSIPFWSPNEYVNQNIKLEFALFSRPDNMYTITGDYTAYDDTPPDVGLAVINEAQNADFMPAQPIIFGYGEQFTFVDFMGAKDISLDDFRLLHAFSGNPDVLSAIYSMGEKYGFQNGYDSGYDVAKDEWRKKGYANGYETGHNEGFDAGWQDCNNIYIDRVLPEKETQIKESYENGYANGKADADKNAFNSGFHAGKASVQNDAKTFSSLFFGILDAPFEVIRKALNFEIFGINLSSLVLFLTSCALGIWAIRLIKRD